METPQTIQFGQETKVDPKWVAAPATLPFGTKDTPPPEPVGLEDRLRAKSGYGNQSAAEVVGGAKKIVGSLQAGADSMKGTPLDFTQGKDYAKSFTPTKIANATIGAGQAGAGVVTGAAQTVFAPITPVVQGLVSATLQGLKNQHPVIAKAFDILSKNPETQKVASDLSSKIDQFSKNLDPRTLPLFGDLLNTALLSFVGGDTKIGIPNSVKEAFSKEGAQGVLQGTKGIASDVSGTVKKAGSVIKDVATSGKQLSVAESGLEDLKNVKTDLAAQKSELPIKENTKTLVKNDINQSIKDVKAASKSDIKDMTNTFKETNQTLQNTLKNKAELQTAQNKGTLKTLFKDMSDTYKSGLDQAEQAMAKRGATLKSSDFSKVIDDTLQTAKDYGVDVSDSTIKALKEVQAELAKGKPLSLDKLTVLKQKIYNASQMGKDFVNDEFMRNYGTFLEKSVPELKALNEEFAPMAQAKRWANKTFAPYDEAVIDKGAKVLTDLAKGEKPTQTTANYLKNLSEGSGKFKGAGDLVGDTTKAGENIKVTEKMFNDAKNNLLTSTDKQLADLDTQLKQVNDEISGIKTEGKKLGKGIADQNALIKQQTDIVKRLANLKKIRNSIIISTLSTVGLGVGGSIFKATQSLP